jgi:hypothetical protein
MGAAAMGVAGREAAKAAEMVVAEMAVVAPAAGDRKSVV